MSLGSQLEDAPLPLDFGKGLIVQAPFYDRIVTRGLTPAYTHLRAPYSPSLNRPGPALTAYAPQ